jgi:hypothetical protein
MIPRSIIVICLVLLVLVVPRRARAEEETFRWIDFHSQKDQDVVVWVTRALEVQKWTSIREIGVLYDAALVVTTERPNVEASPSQDTFTVWSVSLTTHALTILLKGSNLRWLDWMQLSESGAREIGALYDDCGGCEATTYFTAFHYDMSQRIFVPRWIRGGQAAAVWSSATPAGVDLTRVYAVLAEPNGRETLGTWSHFNYGKQKQAEDFVYLYDVDPFRSLDRAELLSGRDAEAMKQKLCSIDGAAAGLARGQDSALCQQTARPRSQRKPVTTPPANNQGRSLPPGLHN